MAIDFEDNIKSFHFRASRYRSYRCIERRHKLTMACVLIVGDTGTSAALGRIRELLDSTSALSLLDVTCAVFDMPVVEYILSAEPKTPTWERDSDFIAYAGKIRKVWDYWYERFMFWEPVEVAQGVDIIFNKRFTRRFQGFNHGRHWDRKRR